MPDDGDDESYSIRHQTSTRTAEIPNGYIRFQILIMPSASAASNKVTGGGKSKGKYSNTSNLFDPWDPWDRTQTGTRVVQQQQTADAAK